MFSKLIRPSLRRTISSHVVAPTVRTVPDTITALSRDDLKAGQYFNWNEPTEADKLLHPVEQVFEAGMRHHHIANTAYPIAHAETIRPYRVPRWRDQKAIKETLVGAYGSLDEMMFYVHVPFCQQRCQFCEYTVVDPKQGKRDDVQDRYFDALLKEMDMYQDLLNTPEKNLAGFDIGGGTPSFASIFNIERVMTKIGDMFRLPDNMDISIETTPKVAANEPEKIKAYYDMGIRRISMGVQTTDFSEAKKLGRQDEGFLDKAVANIRAAGFESFNIDLMYGFPVRKGREQAWPDTVRNAIALGPEHITLYRMRYKGTRMSHLQDRVGLGQVNAQEGQARDILNDHGYHGWIGKNTYSRTPGSSGCSDYLERRVVNGIPYIGAGLGAQSFSRHTLAYNLGAVTKQLGQYLRSTDLGRIPIQDLYHLPTTGAMGKFISVSFYFGGIDRDSFRYCFGEELEDRFGREVEFLKANRLMEDIVDADTGSVRFGMTKAGKRHFAGVVALFYDNAIKRHLINRAGGDEYRLPSTVHELETELNSFDKPIDSNEAERYTAAQACHPDASHDDPIQTPMLDEWARYHSDGSLTVSVNGTTTKYPSVKAYRATLASNRQPVTRAPVRMLHSSRAVQAATQPASQYVRPQRSLLNLTTPQEQQEQQQPEFGFGNILFAGPCNEKCYFCIGKQLTDTLSQNNLKQWPLNNIERFIQRMRASGTKKVIFTGTTTDPQLYKHEARLLALLRADLPGVHISLHTNGLLAVSKWKEFQSYDSCTISLNSFNPDTFRRVHGVKSMPAMNTIMDRSAVPVKLSCVVTKENYDEVKSGEYLQKAASLGVKRVAIRHLFGSMKSATDAEFPLFEDLTPTRIFCNNPVYNINGVEVTHWVFDSTQGASLNLFSDGTISEHYLLSKAQTSNNHN